jgi:MFS family permease
MKKHFFLFVCSFFFAMGNNILNFSLIFRLTDNFHFNPGQVGTFMAYGLIFYFLGCNLYHRIGSAFNPARILPVSAGVVFLASIPLGFVQTLGSAYASFWLLQLATSLFWPPILAWLTEGLSGNELSRKISYFNRSWMLALIVAPYIAGRLYQWNSDINFFVISLCFFINVSLIFLIKRFSKEQHPERENTEQPAEPSAADKHGSSPLQQSKKLDSYRYIAWIGLFCSVMFAGVLITIVPLHIRDGLGYTESTAGIVLLFRCIASFIGFVLLAKITAWHFNFRWLIIQQAGLALCAFLFLLAGNQVFFYFGIVVLYGFMSSLCITSSTFYSRATGKNPKKNLALHEMFLCAGNAVGTAGGGQLYQHFGFPGICIALMLVLVAFLGVFVVIKRKNP